MLSRFSLAVLAAAFLFALPAPASAEWRRAESDRFIVYSNSRESVLRDYVQKLEMLDRVMQYRSGIPINTTPPRKLPIYLVSGRPGLLRINPASGSNTMGTYFPTQEDGRATGLGLCIGSSINMITGRLPRAPKWAEERGLVWRYSLTS